MKKTIPILIMVALLLFLCITEELLVKTTLKTINTKAMNIYSYVYKIDDVDNVEILKLTHDLNDYWLEHENLLCFFINHKDMHEMGNELVKMISYARSDIREEYITSLELVINYTKTFRHLMGISFQNFL